MTHLVQEDLIAEAQFPARGTGQESNRKLPCEQAGGQWACTLYSVDILLAAEEVKREQKSSHPFSCGGSQAWAEVDSSF